MLELSEFMAGYVAIYPPDSEKRKHKLKNCIRVAQGFDYVKGESAVADRVFEKYRMARLKTKGDKLKLKRAFEKLGA